MGRPTCCWTCCAPGRPPERSAPQRLLMSCRTKSDWGSYACKRPFWSPAKSEKPINKNVPAAGNQQPFPRAVLQTHAPFCSASASAVLQTSAGSFSTLSSFNCTFLASTTASRRPDEASRGARAEWCPFAGPARAPSRRARPYDDLCSSERMGKLCRGSAHALARVPSSVLSLDFGVQDLCEHSSRADDTKFA